MSFTDADLGLFVLLSNLQTGLAAGDPAAEAFLDRLLASLVAPDGWSLLDAGEARTALREAIIDRHDDETPWFDAVAVAVDRYLIRPDDG